ncbi:UNVERIFIED_CONTAM: hypothetical protein Sradi_3650200 [Sesamum radiatum]|uniref:Uncharacterized protein n=1 Tax=Sesamum radiatum TaxID=300843 RepID=A0AAW2QIX1_SESRA
MALTVGRISDNPWVTAYINRTRCHTPSLPACTAVATILALPLRPTSGAAPLHCRNYPSLHHSSPFLPQQRCEEAGRRSAPSHGCCSPPTAAPSLRQTSVAATQPLPPFFHICPDRIHMEQSDRLVPAAISAKATLPSLWQKQTSVVTFTSILNATVTGTPTSLSLLYSWISHFIARL